PAERKLIRNQRIQFFIRRPAEIDTNSAVQRLSSVLHDCDNCEVPQGSGVIAPAQALRRIRVPPVGAEVNAKAWILRSCGVSQCLHVLNRSQRESSLWVKPIRVDENQPEAP